MFGVLKHFDSLRELEIGMKAETMKLSHLGLDYVVRRSTLAEANLRRSQEFFAKVYAYLLERYTPFLPDSNSSKWMETRIVAIHFEHLFRFLSGEGGQKT